MGTTPFGINVSGASITFPDWKFENMDDKDLLSIHVDDFWGVPWDYCNALGCSNLPAAWTGQWQQLASDARASGKTLYLAVSPLGDRRTLAPRVLASGSTDAHWNTAVDAAGCYLFASDPAAATYKAAYISFLKYVIDLVGPTYMSPAIEMNMPFTICPAQKAAWIAWYADVHNALKSAYPALVVFPTFQMEYMYGIAEASAACIGGTLSQCFDQRLGEALTVPGDRIAFSTYPISWKYQAEFAHSYPLDAYAHVKQATTKKIWVSETGWATVRIRQTYPHGGVGSCGADVVPVTLNVPGVGTVGMANDTEHAAYLAWLLGEAQTQGMEAVVWWLDRDYLDGAVAETCPCAPATADTCVLTDMLHTIASDFGELLLRGFGNMALRNYDGSPRPGQSTWRSYVSRTYRP